MYEDESLIGDSKRLLQPSKPWCLDEVVPGCVVGNIAVRMPGAAQTLGIGNFSSTPHTHGAPAGGNAVSK